MTSFPHLRRPSGGSASPQVTSRTGTIGRQIAVGIAAVAAATLALAMPAWAHVDADLGDVSQSGLAEITFSFQHGCSGAATTALRIQTPEGVSKITLEPAPGFTANASDSEFGWSGGSVPDGESASFALTAQLSGRAGQTIAFPTIQQCGDAEIAWVESPGASNSDETEHPAPSIVLAATYEDPNAAPADNTTVTKPADTNDDTSQATPSTAPTGLVTSTTLSENAVPQDSPTTTSGLIVFIVILVILVGGALYLYLSNRKPRPPAAPGSEPVDGPPADNGGDAGESGTGTNPRRSPH